MKTLPIILAASVMTVMSASAFAEDEQVIKEDAATTPNYLAPVSVRAEVGTSGYGGAVSYRVNPYVGLSLGYNGGDLSWSDDIKVDGSTYDLDMENNNTYLNAELYPWGASANNFANSVYVATGVAYLDNDYDLTRHVASGQGFTVNKTDYVATSDVNINGKMSYKNDIAPYLGLGIAPKITKNLGVFGEVGAYYTGNPTVQLTSSGTATTAPTNDALATAVSNEQDKIANDNKYEWLPVAKVGLSFKF